MAKSKSTKRKANTKINEPKRKLFKKARKFGDLPGTDSSCDDSQDETYCANLEINDQTSIKENPVKIAKICPKQSENNKNSRIKNTSKHNSLWSDGLPYELLCKIFRYYMLYADGDMNKLKNLEQVCEYWKKVSQDDTLWFHVVVSKIIQMTKSKFPGLIEKKENLREFESKLNDFYLKNDAKFRFIVKLDLSHLEYMTGDSLDFILNNCDPNLIEYLNVSACKSISANKSNKPFEEIIAERCPKIKKLYMSELGVVKNLLKVLVHSKIDKYLLLLFRNKSIQQAVCFYLKNLEKA